MAKDKCDFAGKISIEVCPRIVFCRWFWCLSFRLIAQRKIITTGDGTLFNIIIDDIAMYNIVYI
ncbi:MAG: hypothetical protein CMP10_07360 [Zetaproteobacteria bacterium]|nr:hypothetical protein [Pseudobdellovibrionaceae bacterium]